MTREEAKCIIQDMLDDAEKYGDIDYDNLNDFISACKVAIEAFPDIPDTNVGKWIPVSERLPKAGEYIGDVEKYYLVQNEYGDMLVARYTHGEYWEQIYQLKPIGDDIVAWMPLPTPFKEEGEK